MEKKVSYEFPRMIRHDGLVAVAQAQHATGPQGPGGPAGFATTKPPFPQKG
ncbi:Hypothetical protein A7982_04938 [Minicystis rosea]|nr:Hypothetical protein A7982_04938 [Minicystis rosea]